MRYSLLIQNSNFINRFFSTLISHSILEIHFLPTLISHSILRNSLFFDSYLAFNFQKFTFGRLLSRILFREIHFFSTLISHSIFRNSLLVDSHLAFNFQKVFFSDSYPEFKFYKFTSLIVFYACIFDLYPSISPFSRRNENFCERDFLRLSQVECITEPENKHMSQKCYNEQKFHVGIGCIQPKSQLILLIQALLMLLAVSQNELQYATSNVHEKPFLNIATHSTVFWVSKEDIDLISGSYLIYNSSYSQKSFHQKRHVKLLFLPVSDSIDPV